MTPHDMITAFNCITGKRVNGVDSIFTDIIEYHYEKYKYFYHILSSIPSKSVKDIFGDIDDDILVIALEANKLEDLPKIYKAINKSKGTYILSESFTLGIEETDSIVYLRIGLSPELEREDTIYEA